MRDSPSLVWGRPAKSSGDLNLEKYKDYLQSKYSKVYSVQLFTYTLRHLDAYDNLSLVDAIPKTVRNNALKALTALSKYKGEYETFHSKLKAHGIKWISQDALTKLQ